MEISTIPSLLRSSFFVLARFVWPPRTFFPLDVRESRSRDILLCFISFYFFLLFYKKIWSSPVTFCRSWYLLLSVELAIRYRRTQQDLLTGCFLLSVELGISATSRCSSQQDHLTNRHHADLCAHTTSYRFDSALLFAPRQTISASFSLRCEVSRSFKPGLACRSLALSNPGLLGIPSAYHLSLDDASSVSL